MQTAGINGAEIEYEVVGRGDGEPVLFLHGVLLGDSFRPMFAEPDVADSHRCILYHRRGYAGSSPRPVADSIPERPYSVDLPCERLRSRGDPWAVFG